MIFFTVVLMFLPSINSTFVASSCRLPFARRGKSRHGLRLCRVGLRKRFVPRPARQGASDRLLPQLELEGTGVTWVAWISYFLLNIVNGPFLTECEHKGSSSEISPELGFFPTIVAF